MAMEENVFITQKYFVFKLSDILNNSFHIFEEKRLESLLFMIEICLGTYDEMHSTAIGTDKLEKSYRGLLNALAFQLKKHPFRKLPIYRRDFECLKVMIANEHETKLNSYEINISLKSLKKKLEKQNLSECYANCLQSELSYQEVDDLIEALVSDLLYKGYSLNYLYDWYVKNIRTEELFLAMEAKDISAYIMKLKCLNGDKKEYEIVVPYKVNNEDKKGMAIQLLSKNFRIKKKSDFFEYVSEWIWQEEVYACKVYSATDYFKAIKMAKKEFATECELFAMWQGDENIIRANKNIGCIDNEKLVLQRELQELIMLVTEPDKLKKLVMDYNESILHDLDCIYRLRNQLIHSAKSMDDSLEDISLRLYRYVNSIVATILYYKKSDAQISIVEILNSLHNTYELFMEKLNELSKKKTQKSESVEAEMSKSKLSVEEGYKIVRPEYLFIE